MVPHLAFVWAPGAAAGEGRGCPAPDSPPSLLPLVAQGGEAEAPRRLVLGSRLAAVATGVRVRIGVELRAPSVYNLSGWTRPGCGGSPAPSSGSQRGLRAGFQPLRASAEWIPFRSPSRPRWGPRENVELRGGDCNSLTVTGLAFGVGVVGGCPRGFLSWWSEWGGWAHVGPAQLLRDSGVAVAVTLKVTEMVGLQ